jgi:hypothetical protein
LGESYERQLLFYLVSRDGGVWIMDEKLLHDLDVRMRCGKLPHRG